MPLNLKWIMNKKHGCKWDFVQTSAHTQGWCLSTIFSCNSYTKALKLEHAKTDYIHIRTYVQVPYQSTKYEQGLEHQPVNQYQPWRFLVTQLTTQVGLYPDLHYFNSLKFGLRPSFSTKFLHWRHKIWHQEAMQAFVYRSLPLIKKSCSRTYPIVKEPGLQQLPSLRI